MFFASEREFKKALRDTFKFKFNLFASSARGTNSYQQWQIEVKFNILLFRYFYNHLSNYTKTIRLGEYSPLVYTTQVNSTFRAR